MFIKNKNKIDFVGADKDATLSHRLEAGLYNVEITRSFFGKTFSFIKTDSYKGGSIITKGVHGDIWNLVNRFASEESIQVSKYMGAMHKLGLLFNGKGGTGKTFLAGQIAQKFIREKDAIGIITNQWDEIELSKFIDRIREHDEDRMIVLILDEFEKVSNSQISDPEFLSFMDGGNSKNNLIVIATTNNLQKLPKLLTDRPGRFEGVYTFDIKDEEIIKSTIIDLLPECMKTTDNKTYYLTLLTNKAKNLTTIDHIRVLVKDEIINFLQKNPDIKLS